MHSPCKRDTTGSTPVIGSKFSYSVIHNSDDYYDCDETGVTYPVIKWWVSPIRWVGRCWCNTVRDRAAHTSIIFDNRTVVPCRRPESYEWRTFDSSLRNDGAIPSCCHSFRRCRVVWSIPLALGARNSQVQILPPPPFLFKGSSMAEHKAVNFADAGSSPVPWSNSLWGKWKISMESTQRVELDLRLPTNSWYQGSSDILSALYIEGQADSWRRHLSWTQAILKRLVGSTPTPSALVGSELDWCERLSEEQEDNVRFVVDPPFWWDGWIG